MKPNHYRALLIGALTVAVIVAKRYGLTQTELLAAGPVVTLILGELGLRTPLVDKS